MVRESKTLKLSMSSFSIEKLHFYDRFNRLKIIG